MQQYTQVAHVIWYLCAITSETKNQNRRLNYLQYVSYLHSGHRMYLIAWSCWAVSLLSVSKKMISNYIFSLHVSVMSKPPTCKHTLTIVNLMFLWPCIMNWPYKTTNVMHWILFTRTLIESDGTICCLCTTMSSWRWVLDTRNM